MAEILNYTGLYTKNNISAGDGWLNVLNRSVLTLVQMMAGWLFYIGQVVWFANFVAALAQ